MCVVIRGSIVQLDVVEAYHGNDLVPNFRLLRRIFWTFGPCISTFRHCKAIIQVDVTHLYRKYKGAILITVAKDDNQNILPVVFIIIEGETIDA